MLLGIAVDLATKEVAFRYVAGVPVGVDRQEVLASGRNPGNLVPFHQPVVVIPKVLDFTLVLNPGAVFGIGAGKRWFFMIFTGGALIFGVLLFGAWTRPDERLSHVALGLLLAGGLGNLYDRMFLACVRDFIHPLPDVHLPFGWAFPWGGTEVWPYVSNAADLFLIIGILLLVYRSIRTGHRAEPASPARPPK